ncbi:MAG: hypothetical protein EBZ74_07465 [Planctomycetia bacterium]|nr:hypothetical protein [Planctomycetia bacterium]
MASHTLHARRGRFGPLIPNRIVSLTLKPVPIMNLASQASSPLSSACRVGAILLIGALLACGPLASAADMVWVGGDSFNSSNFTNSGNWQNNTQPSWGTGNSLKFSQNLNSNVTGLNYNYGDWRDANDIYWDTTFTVSRTLQQTGGGGIRFTTRIENNSSYAQTAAMNLSGGQNGASDIQLNPVKGSLILSGTIYNDNSLDYTVYGSDTATVTTLTLNTELGPNAPNKPNVDFTVAGGRNSNVQVNASQSWAGTTTVNSGAFTTANGVTLASSAIVVAGGTVATTSANTFADTATLTVNSGRLSIGGSDTVASLAGTGGTVDLAAGTTLTAGDAGATSYAGSITGSGGFTKVGSGALTLSGNNSYGGGALVSQGVHLLRKRIRRPGRRQHRHQQHRPDGEQLREHNHRQRHHRGQSWDRACQHRRDQHRIEQCQRLDRDTDAQQECPGVWRYNPRLEWSHLLPRPDHRLRRHHRHSGACDAPERHQQLHRPRGCQQRRDASVGCQQWPQ